MTVLNIGVRGLEIWGGGGGYESVRLASMARAASTSSGVRGHIPPGNFEKQSLFLVGFYA